MVINMGWKGESRRHSLSRKGIKTNLPDGRRFDVSNYVARGNDTFVILNKKGEPAKNITIIGRKWFQRTYGNTYHSVEVYVDGELIEYDPFQYGYGEQYKQTAHDILMKHGLAPKTDIRLPSGMGKDYHDFLTDMRENRDKYVISVTDVTRKGDL